MSEFMYTGLLWGAYCFFFGAFSLSCALNLISEFRREAYRQGIQDGKPIRLKDGRLVGRK